MRLITRQTNKQARGVAKKKKKRKVPQSPNNLFTRNVCNAVQEASRWLFFCLLDESVVLHGARRLVHKPGHDAKKKEKKKASVHNGPNKSHLQMH